MKTKVVYGDRQMLRWISVIVVTLVLFGIVVGAAWPATNWKSFLAIVVSVILLQVIINFATTKLAARFMGSKGEYKVWVILNELYHLGFRTISNLELTDRGDIDHVVVGPTGVWAIESKFIDGEISMIDGKLARDGIQFHRDFLKQTHAEAFAVRDCLKSNGFDVSVKPLLVFSKQLAKVRFGDAPISGVYVIGSMYLRKVICDTRLGNILNREQITAIVGVLEAANNGA